MRYAIVSDIHANLPAWNAVLEDIQSQQIEQIINLGDSVGYGPNPAEVLASVRAHVAVSVLGNHDAVCAMRLDPAIFNDRARAVIEWTQGQIDDEATTYLKALPEMAYPDDESFLITHAEVVKPLEFGYILTADHAEENFAACEDSVIFIGHTHYPGVFAQDESGQVTVHDPGPFHCESPWRYMINPGSVGDPRSADIVASYCIFDSVTRGVEFRRVAFDTEAYRQLFDASGLTAKPFFLRYLDESKKGTVKILIPDVMETDLSRKLILGTPAVLKIAPKKKSPALALMMLFLAICIGSVTWVMTQLAEKEDIQEVPKELEISVSAEVTEEEIKPAPPIITKLPATGRYLRISNPRGRYLSLAEVIVVSDGKNVALRKKASQSSTFSRSMSASKALDGNTKGNKSNLISHTLDQRPMWWEVDLGADTPIETIVLWNRNEGAKLMQRLDGFTLEIFDSKRQVVYRTKDNPGAKLKIVIQ